MVDFYAIDLASKKVLWRNDVFKLQVYIWSLLKIAYFFDTLSLLIMPQREIVQSISLYECADNLRNVNW